MRHVYTVYLKKYAHGFCFAVLCCGYTLTDFPISIRLTSLALWQSNDCPSASKGTLVNMDKYFMWIHYERLHNHNKAKHNKTVCIFLGIYCKCQKIDATLGLMMTVEDCRYLRITSYRGPVTHICAGALYIINIVHKRLELVVAINRWKELTLTCWQICRNQFCWLICDSR